MNPNFRKGLYIGLIFYLFGATVTMVVHHVSGWEYMHAPPPSAFVVLIVLLLALVRSVWLVTNLDSRHATRHKGELAVHGLPMLGFIILVISLIMS
ncbi:MAG: hypothetical protein ABJF11_11170 [Reichenbachiella sp.]|uniref:hypothetical protein n=1 Tax=Reichenbachiella sp. TaxID=2184521 RepID=UPI003264ECDE